ncbi:cold shock domain-containing protein [Nodosilinea sp. LEGE 06152]|uniref:cold shock domain-containing protein n=1 Tax=Nodosilinea sp. LEGE 06152 TaxID=2777966 RepID=UPI00187EF52A|nr:cold shock domain-containing protein [Nodosilinea sp. LEGE 06152]MBE9159634.1 cold shock domain-containing protein [Nodosilinea sp. LEGE 06152]
MAPVSDRGQLKTWKDDRGFGFIKPEGGGKDVFLHISALPRASRRPQIGDTILYEKVAEPDGKVRAARASIQGVVTVPQQTTKRSPNPDPRPARRKPKQTGWLESLTGIVGLVIVAAFAIPSVYKSIWTRLDTNPPASSITQPETTTPPTPIEAVIDPSCVVKGNISISTGKKLYHVPGMEDYEGTEIHLDEGERWFCTEADAIAAGWSRAPR